MVEFALVLPLFALLICAICDFGCYFFVEHTLQWATREGERLGLVGGTLNDAKGNPETTAQSIVDTIKKYAGVAVDPSKLSISIFPITPPYTNPTGWQSELDSGGPGDTMRVITQYTYTFFTPFMAYFFPKGNLLIQSEATYRNELF
ncbi:MAG: TadE/TadG family type IV pilus assembly protein [Syntrophobacteraceae bacterium]|nr:TadE/TadG family type IV pilus assembly protein [Syntrophobacteraceae bacterium]